MASFRMNLLARVDKIRGRVPGRLGLRPRTVTVRVITWSGDRVGKGTPTPIDTQVLNSGYSPKITAVSSKDVVASGGLYEMGDFKVGPITQAYLTGGTAHATLDPPTTATAREVLFILAGEGFPDGGLLCKRIDSDDLKNFHVEVTLRSVGIKP